MIAMNFAWKLIFFAIMSVYGACLNSNYSNCHGQPSDCYWRFTDTDYAKRQTDGVCINSSVCTEANNQEECLLFKNIFKNKPCNFDGGSCKEVSCNQLTSENCTSHGMPRLFCSISGSNCVGAAEICENSGANDHASCKVASDFLKGRSGSGGAGCIFKYSNDGTGSCIPYSSGVEVTCGDLNLEECESLPHDYLHFVCKVVDSECIEVTRCNETDEAVTEIECLSNRSQSNPCFYVSSTPPPENFVGSSRCFLLDANFECKNLSTQTKCEYHGIANLECKWNNVSGECEKSDCQSSTSKAGCNSNPTAKCVYAIDTDSDFASDDSFNYRNCHTLCNTSQCPTDDQNLNRLKCQYLKNPAQCNSISHTNSNSKEQLDCVYTAPPSSECSIKGGCEGKCVTWSFVKDANVGENLVFPDDCAGVTNDQCQSPAFMFQYEEGKLMHACGWASSHCFKCTEFNTASGQCSFPQCDIPDTESACNTVSGCKWIDSKCQIQKFATCDSILYDGVSDFPTCNTADIPGGCQSYPQYYEPAYQEIVSYRCRAKAVCNNIRNSVDCNNAGIGDGQTCFWQEGVSNTSQCVNTSIFTKCEDFSSNQCPVTFSQLLPFVGLTRICRVNNNDRCEDSDYISIPNYCARHQWEEVGDDNYNACVRSGTCSAVAKVCIPDSAKSPECQFFGEVDCRYIDFNGDQKFCEWHSGKCVDANFLQCSEISVDKCLTGTLREKTKQCLIIDNACKINRCFSGRNSTTCEDPNTQNGACQWSNGACVPRTCEGYLPPLQCPGFCNFTTTGSVCSTYPECNGISPEKNCTDARLVGNARCFWSTDETECKPVTHTSCEDTQDKDECKNMKPKDGYKCEWRSDDVFGVFSCQLFLPSSCQGIFNPRPNSGDCQPIDEFKDFCLLQSSTANSEVTHKCVPTCEVITDSGDCIRESSFCDFYKGSVGCLKTSEARNCEELGQFKCNSTQRCRWDSNETGCVTVPEQKAESNEKMTRVVIICSVVGGVVILLLIGGIVLVVLLHLRDKKRLEKQMAEAENLRDGEGDGDGNTNSYEAGGGGFGGGNQNN